MFNGLLDRWFSLKKGFPRTKLEKLLSKPDYSPTEGQYYYSSDRRIFLKDEGGDTVFGLIVDYRDEKGNVTDSVQEFTFGRIGESLGSKPNRRTYRQSSVKNSKQVLHNLKTESS